MRPDTQLSDEMAGVSETACAVEASRRPISRRTLPEPADATAVFTLVPRTRRSRKVWALLTSELRGCRFSAARGRRRVAVVANRHRVGRRRPRQRQLFRLACASTGKAGWRYRSQVGNGRGDPTWGASAELPQ